MASIKLLGNKRYFTDIKDEKNEDIKNEFNPPIVKLINYTEKEINDLILEELDSSWNQKNYKISKKEPLKNEKYKIKKNFSTNIKIFKDSNRNLLNKVRSNNDLLNQERNYISYCLEMKNYSIEDLIVINKSKNIEFKKFNLILDIDSTMIKAVELNEINIKQKDTYIEVKGTINNNQFFELYYRYRPYLFYFIKEIKNYFNIFISTLGHTNYANKILEDFKQKAEIIIPERNIISNINLDKFFKNISDFEGLSEKEELNNTVIFDDIVNFWIKPLGIKKDDNDIEQCIKCLIPSKRYIINNPNNGNDKAKYGLLVHNNIFEEKYNNMNTYSIDVDYQFVLERDSDSDEKKGKYGQFYYLTEFLKKCIRYSLFGNIPLVNAMDFYRKKVFENCKFNLKYLSNEWHFCITNIIKELGGTIVLSTEEATHFIVEGKTVSIKKDQIFVNVNYIFQCYFNLTRLNENEKKKNGAYN